MTNRPKLSSLKNTSLGFTRPILNKFNKIYNFLLAEFDEQLFISNNLIAHLFCSPDRNNNISESFVYSYESYQLRQNHDINITNYDSYSSYLLFAVFLILSLSKAVLLNLKTDSFKFFQSLFIRILIRCKCLKILISDKEKRISFVPFQYVVLLSLNNFFTQRFSLLKSYFKPVVLNINAIISL